MHADKGDSKFFTFLLISECDNDKLLVLADDKFDGPEIT